MSGTDGASGPRAPADIPGRLRWRCRRGTRELDLLLGAYLENRYPVAPDEEKQAFEELLEWPDPEILAALTGTLPVGDGSLRAVLEAVRLLPR